MSLFTFVGKLIIKPFWNDELMDLWHIVVEFENKYLACPQNSSL